MSDTVSTILILAVVALFEGVRRLSPGAFVLRRLLWRRWNAVAPLELGRDWYLVAWPIPVVHSLIIGRGGSNDALGIGRHMQRLRARVRRTRIVIATLRALGTIILVGLVVGVPIATLRWDVFGLVVSLETVFLACVAQGIITHIGLRRAGAVQRFAVLESLKMLWPFSAPRAAEIVQDQIARGTPWILVLVELLGRERFLVEMRAGLYDELARGEVNGTLAALYGRNAIAAFLREPVDGASTPFCPRCAAQYREGIQCCANCEGVALIA
jgi:hypothetical protein